MFRGRVPVRVVPILTVFVAGSVLATVSSAAAIAQTTVAYSVTPSGPLLTVTGDAGVNDITMFSSGTGGVEVNDPSSIVDSSGQCFQLNSQTLVCPPVLSIVASGGPGDDRISNQTAIPSTLRGGAGRDTLIGGPNGDRLLGQAGNDTLDGGTGPDLMDGGDGEDTVTYASRTASVFVYLTDSAFPTNGERNEGDTTFSIENLIGGTGDDDLEAYVGTEHVLRGGDGDDHLASTGNDVLLDGGNGNDDFFMLSGSGARMLGGPGNDTQRYATNEQGPITFDGGPGNDSATGTSFADTLNGGDGKDHLGIVFSVADGDDVINGGSGDDVLIGGLGNDTITGGPGIDSIDGGAGTDTCHAGPQGGTPVNCEP